MTTPPQQNQAVLSLGRCGVGLTFDYFSHGGTAVGVEGVDRGLARLYMAQAYTAERRLGLRSQAMWPLGGWRGAMC